ncbi:hypothetical protein [Rhizobium cauense]|nr:hypothetical protein [Rhizobium cauense]
MANKGKIEGGKLTDDDGDNEVQRKGKGRKESSEHTNVKVPVHHGHPF